MDTVMPIVLMLGVGLFAVGQNAYYSKKVQRMEEVHTRQLEGAKYLGRCEALQDPKAVMHAYHKMFTYTMN